MKQQSEEESAKSDDTTNENPQESNSKICSTHLIEDSPAYEDLLSFDDGDIGPHERVAQAIAGLVQSDEPGGKMIGLEGGWGSGKTTVINILQKIIEKDIDITVFPFDTWAHEGDPLRRTYLESMIEHLQGKNWIDKEEWDKTLDKLTKRLRVIKTTTTQKITNFGKILAASVFLVPIGVPIIAAQLSPGITVVNGTTISRGTVNPTLLIVGFVLAAAPLIVTIGNFIYLKYKSRKSSSKKKDDSKHWAILAGKTDEEITQDTTETPDPTSIEFEKYFSELIKEALSKYPKRKMILVIDNLDRVDPVVALSNWSTLQTFLQDREINRKEWFKRLWIIVPYDADGLRRLWANRSSVQDDPKQEVPASFIDKSFQIRFEVSPPVLSNWKMYLKKIAASALPKHSEEDYHTIYNVFDLCRENNEYAPTPRELILYINQIGAIHRQWQHEFPIGHVAYYSILRRNQGDIRKSLISGAVPDKKIESILLPDLRVDLAGLYFNVKANLGMQLLLNGPICDALEKSNEIALKELEKNYKEGFWAVLDEYVISAFTEVTPDVLTKAVLCLDKSGILKNQVMAVTVIKEIGRKASSTTNWAPFDENISSGIATIIRLASDKDVSGMVISGIQRTITEQIQLDKSDEEKEESPTIETIVKGLVAVCEQIYQNGHQDVLANPFKLPIDALGWIDACSYIHQQERKYWSRFKPNVQFGEISNIVCEAVTKGQFSKEHLEAVEMTQATLSDCNWNSLVQTFGQRLNAGQNPNNQEAKLILDGLSLLRQYGTDSIQSESKRLANEGHLMHRLHQAQSQNDIQCTACYIAMFLEQNPGVTKPPSIGNSDAGYNTLITLLGTDDNNLATHIVNILQAYNNLDVLLLVSDKRGEKYDPLILRCLRIVADGETPEALYTPKVIIENWRDFRNCLGEDEFADRFEKLIGRLCINSNLTEEVLKTENQFKCDNAGLYATILKTSSSKSFKEWCRSGLENMDDNEWKQDLDNEADALILMLALTETGITVKLKRPFKDALVEHAKEILNATKSIPDKLVVQWPRALNALGKGNERKTLRRELRDAVMDQSGKCADVFFDFYGEEIANDDILTEERMVVHKLFTPLLKERAIGGLKWLRDLFSNHPNIVEKFTDTASVQEFHERIEDEISQSKDDEAQKLIADIANILGIEPREETAEEEISSGEDSPEDKNSAK